MDDLSTDYFIMALKKFIALRGRPPRIYSDNGTNFVGGAWERLVQCAKKTLKSVLQNRIVAKEALRTALVEAEGVLSSRPITHVSNSAGDIEALTPNHFLLLRANLSNEEAEVSEREINVTKLWRRSQALVNTSFGRA